MVSGNKRRKSKPTSTPTKTTDQTVAQRQPLLNDENLENLEPNLQYRYSFVKRTSKNK